MGIFSRIFGKTSQKSDDMVWADEFTLQMGLEFDDLFGVFAMPQSFADAPRLLKIFYAMINTDRSTVSVGCSGEERFSRLHNVMSGCSQREQEVLMKFWNFFGDVCVRIRNNPDFGREIRNLPKDHYKMMPGIYTYQIMNWASQLMAMPEERTRKQIARTPTKKLQLSKRRVGFLRNIVVAVVSYTGISYCLWHILSLCLCNDPLWKFQSDAVAMGCVISLWPICAMWILSVAHSHLTSLQYAFFGNGFHACLLSLMIPSILYGIGLNPGWIVPRICFGIGLFALLIVSVLAWDGIDGFLSELKHKGIIEHKGFHHTNTFYSHIRPWQKFLWRCLLIANVIAPIAAFVFVCKADGGFIGEEKLWGRLVESNHLSAYDLTEYLKKAKSQTRKKMVVDAAVQSLRKDCSDIIEFDESKFSYIKRSYGSVNCRELEKCLAELALNSNEETYSRLYLYVYKTGAHHSKVEKHYNSMIDYRWQLLTQKCSDGSFHAGKTATEKLNAILAFKSSVESKEYKIKADALMDKHFGKYGAIVREDNIDAYMQYLKEDGSLSNDAIPRAAECAIRSQNKAGVDRLPEEVEALVIDAGKAVLKVANTSTCHKVAIDLELKNSENSYTFKVPPNSIRYYFVEPGSYRSNSLLGGVFMVEIKPSSIYDMSLSVIKIPIRRWSYRRRP